jgi:hypothetical protein
VLREPITLLLAVAVLVATGVIFAARQGFQTLYQTSVNGTRATAQPRLQAMGLAMSAFETSGLAEEALRSSLSSSQVESAAALQPLGDLPGLRGTFLDEADAAAQRTSRALRTELDELAGVLNERADLTHVAYRVQRILSLSSEPTGAAGARRVWVRTYARELLGIDSALQAHVDDLARWRTQELPQLSTSSESDAIRRRLFQTERELQAARDRVRALPVPPEALRPVQEYTAGLARLTAALQALGTYADTHTQASLNAADQELAAYRSALQAPVAALSRLQ